MIPPYAWTVLWPGLSRLWLRGQWRGLAIAIGFALLLNGLIITTFLWPRIIGTEHAAVVVNSLGWFVVLCFWGASTWTAWHLLPRLQPGADVRGDDALFLEAQHEYLKGNWYGAEQRLQRMLIDSPRDADAHLLLATLYRHTRRYDEARRVLDFLLRIDGGAKWLFEIGEEHRRIVLQQERETEDGNQKRNQPEIKNEQVSEESPDPLPASKAA